MIIEAISHAAIHGGVTSPLVRFDRGVFEVRQSAVSAALPVHVVADTLLVVLLLLLAPLERGVIPVIAQSLRNSSAALSVRLHLFAVRKVVGHETWLPTIGVAGVLVLPVFGARIRVLVNCPVRTYLVDVVFVIGHPSVMALSAAIFAGLYLLSSPSDDLRSFVIIAITTI